MTRIELASGAVRKRRVSEADEGGGGKIPWGNQRDFTFTVCGVGRTGFRRTVMMGGAGTE